VLRYAGLLACQKRVHSPLGWPRYRPRKRMRATGALPAATGHKPEGRQPDNTPESSGSRQVGLDLPTLVTKVRPAVMTLVIFDADGRGIGLGTGFVVSPDGKLITNRHVIRHARRIVARPPNGDNISVLEILAVDESSDLAVLQMDGKDLPALHLGSSEQLPVGLESRLSAAPLDLRALCPKGSFPPCVRSRVTDLRVLQISAPISPGSSGSPSSMREVMS